MKHVKKFEDEKVNEHHLQFKEEKIVWISSNIDRLEDADVNYIYRFIENKLNIEQEGSITRTIKKHNLR